jgi:two-component system response regulator DevR
MTAAQKTIYLNVGPKVYLVDGHELIRQGVRHLLERAGAQVVGESDGVTDTLARILRLQPSLVILDHYLPDGDGIALCREIRLRDPTIRCLILADCTDDQVLLQSVRAGADGLVLKKLPSADLIAAVQHIAGGESLFSAELRKRAGAQVVSTSAPDVADLSAQEQKVLALLAEGLTNRQIAHQMYLAEKTVRNYVSILLSKLGFERRTQAAIFASRGEGNNRQRRS